MLQRLGFNELTTYPALLAKLVRSTAFRFQYGEFKQRFMPHMKGSVDATIHSYIGETGSLFRYTGYMILYLYWENQVFASMPFNPPNVQRPDQPLMAPDQVDRFMRQCELIYWHSRLDWMQGLLENFNQANFVSIYDVDAMGGFPFEDFLVRMFRTLGYDVQETKRTRDQGADLFVTRFGQKTVIQAKNYSDTVGNSAVQEVLAAKAFYGADQAMVVTNRYFSPSAKELAAATGVRLVDRDELQSFLDEYNRSISNLDTLASLPGKE